MEKIQGRTGAFLGKNLIISFILLMAMTFSAHAFERMKAEIKNNRITVMIKKLHFGGEKKATDNTRQHFNDSAKTTNITKVIRHSQTVYPDVAQRDSEISAIMALIALKPVEEFLSHVYSLAQQKITTELVQNLIDHNIRESLETGMLKEHGFYSAQATMTIREQITMQEEVLSSVGPKAGYQYVSNLPDPVKRDQQQQSNSLIVALSNQ